MAKISKSRKRRLLVIGTASLVAFVFFCINVFNYSYKIISLTKEQNNLMAELDRLKSEKEDLDIKIKQLQDEEYIANYARENYSYSKDNEIVIKIKDTDSKIEENEKIALENASNLKKLRIGVVSFSLVGLIFFVILARIRKA